MADFGEQSVHDVQYIAPAWITRQQTLPVTTRRKCFFCGDRAQVGVTRQAKGHKAYTTYTCRDDRR